MSLANTSCGGCSLPLDRLNPAHGRHRVGATGRHHVYACSSRCAAAISNIGLEVSEAAQRQADRAKAIAALGGGGGGGGGATVLPDQAELARSLDRMLTTMETYGSSAEVVNAATVPSEGALRVLDTIEREMTAVNETFLRFRWLRETVERVAAPIPARVVEQWMAKLYATTEAAFVLLTAAEAVWPRERAADAGATLDALMVAANAEVRELAVQLDRVMRAPALWTERYSPDSFLSRIPRDIVEQTARMTTPSGGAANQRDPVLVAGQTLVAQRQFASPQSAQRNRWYGIDAYDRHLVRVDSTLYVYPGGRMHEAYTVMLPFAPMEIKCSCLDYERRALWLITASSGGRNHAIRVEIANTTTTTITAKDWVFDYSVDITRFETPTLVVDGKGRLLLNTIQHCHVLVASDDGLVHVEARFDPIHPRSVVYPAPNNYVLMRATATGAVMIHVRGGSAEIALLEPRVDPRGSKQPDWLHQSPRTAPLWVPAHATDGMLLTMWVSPYSERIYVFQANSARRGTLLEYFFDRPDHSRSWSVDLGADDVMDMRAFELVDESFVAMDVDSHGHLFLTMLRDPWVVQLVPVARGAEGSLPTMDRGAPPDSLPGGAAIPLTADQVVPAERRRTAASAARVTSEIVMVGSTAVRFRPFAK